MYVHPSPVQPCTGVSEWSLQRVTFPAADKYLCIIIAPITSAYTFSFTHFLSSSLCQCEFYDVTYVKPCVISKRETGYSRRTST